MSKRSLRNAIRKLRIQKGDVLLVKHYIFDALMKEKTSLVDFDVPMILVENTRDIRKVSKEVLEKVLEMQKEDKR